MDYHSKVKLALATQQLYSATKDLATQKLATGTSTETYGFSGGMTLALEGSKTKSSEESTNSIASNITASNINISTGATEENQALIQGSMLNASNDINIESSNVKIEASRDSSSSNTNTKTVNASISFSTAGVTGASVGGGLSKDELRGQN